MTNKSKQPPLFQKIAENTIGLITTAIFSIGLISGSSYLLFDAQRELNTIEQANAEIEEQLAEINLGIEMATMVGSGWISADSNGMTLGATIALLENSLAYDDLDDSFAKRTIAWSLMSLEQLTSEKEKVKGYVFYEKPILHSQSAFLKVYETKIILIREILDLTQRWEEKNFSERQSQYNVVQLKWIDEKASVDALDSASSQIVSDKEIAQNQGVLKINEITDSYNSYTTRYWLSILGVILGLVLLFGSITYLARKHLQPQKKVPSVAARKIKKPKTKSK